MKKYLLLVAIVLLVGIIAAFLWLGFKSDKPSTTKSNEEATPASSDRAESSSQEPADGAPPLERADYLYNVYTQSTHEDRYTDLKDKGYITENLYQQATTMPGNGHDLITCSQDPAETYTFTTQNDSPTSATITVTTDYSGEAKVFTTEWVNNGTWQLDKVTC